MLRYAAILLMLAPDPSRVWMRSKSIEWWTNISDDVAIVEVAGLDPMEPLNSSWDSSKVRWKEREALRGGALERGATLLASVD